MFDIGFLELALIAVLALLVLGPERLPRAARTVGRAVARARRVAKGLQRQLQEEMDKEEAKLRDDLSISAGLNSGKSAEDLKDASVAEAGNSKSGADAGGQKLP